MLGKKLSAVAFVALLAAFTCGSASAQILVQCPSTGPIVGQKGLCIYSVKFICGVQRPQATSFEPPVKPGNYATAVNVHNYHNSQFVPFRKKAVIALPEDQHPGPISAFRTVELGPDQAVEIDCQDIVSLFGPGIQLTGFIKGFVEILSTLPLSVTGVYTAQGCRLSAVGPICDGPVSVDVIPQQPFAGP